MAEQIKLSPSSINTFLACPRCYWLAMHGKGEPEGYPPALYSILDVVEKNYYDSHRSEGLPPLLKGKLPLKLVDQKTAESLRHYIAWTDPKINAILRGKMDDCFTDDKGTLFVMDNKTRTGEFKEIYPEYLFQLDAYAFLMLKNGFKVGKYGYLVYFVPEKNSSLDKGVKFDTDVHKVKLNPNRVLRIFRKAAKMARRARPPAHHKECEIGLWLRAIEGL